MYAYDYNDCLEKFSIDQMELPTKEQFYSILNDQHVINGEYDHARKVWKTFDIKTMGAYHDLYLNPILDGVRVHPILDGEGKKAPHVNSAI